MKIISFAIQNYRSIKKTRLLKIHDLTVLVGPNNEGKTNLLLGLITALKIVTELKNVSISKGKLRFLSIRHIYSQNHVYNLERDYPKDPSLSFESQPTVFNLTFQLNEDEIKEFKNEVKIQLNGKLPIRISFDKNIRPVFSVPKKGKYADEISKKSDLIAKFIGERFEFEHIPSIRYSKKSEELIASMLSERLKMLESDTTFIEALRKIEELQNPVYTEIAQLIQEDLKIFIPSIKEVSLKPITERNYRRYKKDFDILIDDGIETALSQKGDGVQSLVSLAIMRHLSEKRAGQKKQLFLAIDEPESHLHSKAIHQLQKKLVEISKQNQVLYATHSPSLINRKKISANILVEKNTAHQALNIANIREILGVAASDNLRNAEFILLVEGEDDRISLDKILRIKSQKISEMLNNGTVAIDSLNGGNNLSYKTSLYKTFLCEVHVFLDNDQTGKDSFIKAKKESVLSDAEIHFTNVHGMKESEFEDIININLYKDTLKIEYGVTIDSDFKQRKNGKWSSRIEGLFKRSGKRFDNLIKKELKNVVCKLISESNDNILCDSSSCIDPLIKSIEQRIKQLKK